MFMSRYFILIFFGLLQFQSSILPVDSANILFYAAVGTHSTRISKWPLMEALAEKGHNVTYITIFPGPEDPNSKVKIYVPQKWKEAMGSWEDSVDFFQDRKDRSLLNTFLTWTGYNAFGHQACEVLYSDPEFVSWTKSNKFDLVVMEMFWNECIYGMTYLWKAKLAIYGTSTATPWSFDAYGIPDESSTTHDMMYGFRSDHEITLYERFVNAINPILMQLHREWFHLPVLEKIVKNGLVQADFPGAEKIPSFREIERNNSLLLLTTHFSMDYPRSLPPHVIPVGGNVVSSKPKPLPKEMSDFIQERKDGFVYVSFGSAANLGSYPVEVQTEFINALGKFPKIGFVLKTAVALKVEKIPANVHVTKWAPQQTVLGHPKIKAFITHGGMGSAAETIHFAVPVICIPWIGEQEHNCNMYERKGAGLFVEIVDMKQETLEHAIREIVENKKYKEAMLKVSKIFKDRPAPPVENAVWWVEYILRHHNPHEHLVPKNIHQAWWKRRQIDIWLIAAFLLIAAIAIPAFILSKLVSFVLGGKKSNSNSKNKLKKN